jgi:hypothetical protein
MRPEESRTIRSPGRPAEPQPPESVEAALRQALEHARNAMAEGLLAGRSLIDAASLAIFGEPARLSQAGARTASDARVAFAAMARGIDELATRVRSSDATSAAHEGMLRAMLDALDTEVKRWEQRSAHDADARAVLRAFLGLREILWEFGLRRPDAAATTDDASRHGAPAPHSDRPAASAAREPTPPPRVQRVEVQG